MAHNVLQIGGRFNAANVLLAVRFLSKNLKQNNMYKFLIDPKKWVNVGELELEQNKPYWFKKSNGQIVMGTPFTNGYSSGIADVYAEDGCLRIKGDTFHLVKGGQVQEVLN